MACWDGNMHNLHPRTVKSVEPACIYFKEDANCPYQTEGDLDWLERSSASRIVLRDADIDLQYIHVDEAGKEIPFESGKWVWGVESHADYDKTCKAIADFCADRLTDDDCGQVRHGSRNYAIRVAVELVPLVPEFDPDEHKG